MKGYQVLRADGTPASETFDDLAIYKTRKGARRYISYMKDEPGYGGEKYTIRPVEVIVKTIKPKKPRKTGRGR